MGVAIIEIQPDSPELVAVVDLANKYRARLGFLPRQAFGGYAKSGTILAAQTAEGMIAGYLLYRESARYSRVSIAHLCVDEQYRHHGIAAKLFDHLRMAVAEWPEITLLCRRDYGLNVFWQRLGFQYIGEKPGRGKKPVHLSKFRYSIQQDLFSLPRESTEFGDLNRIKAVVDANVFFEMAKHGQRHPLQADWLADDVELLITPELTVEIHRSSNPKQRQNNLDFAMGFPCTRKGQTDQAHFDQVYQLLRGRLTAPSLTLQDESDLRQLTHSITEKADFFVTRDEPLRQKLGDDAQRHYGITIVRPEELIIQIDEYANLGDYRPDSLAGSSIELHLIKRDEVDAIIRIFHRISAEKQSQFRAKLSVFLNEPSRYRVLVIAKRGSGPIGLLVLERSDPQTLDVPLFLLASYPRLAALASHLLTWLTEVAVAESRNMVRLWETQSDIVNDALEDNHFRKCSHTWVKFCASGVVSIPQLNAFIIDLQKRFTKQGQVLDIISDRLSQADYSKDMELLIGIERMLWPLKISGLDVPCYIVPIQPRWAMDLFDTALGSATLFGSDTSLVFRMDNVYYRSGNTNLPTAPARILWYVSRDPKGRHRDLMAIRASSYVDEVQRGSPKELFAKFSKLGVYSWNDLMRSVEGKGEKSILAFRFGMTELFACPFRLASLKSLLDRKSAPQSPFTITTDQFLTIYKQGRGIAE